MIITEKTKRAILFKPHDAKRVGDGLLLPGSHRLAER